MDGRRDYFLISFAEARVLTELFGTALEGSLFLLDFVIIIIERVLSG